MMAEGYPRNMRSSVHDFRGLQRSSTFAQWAPYDIKYVSQSSSYGGGHVGWRNLGEGDVGGAWFLDKVQYEIQPISLNIFACQGPAWGETINAWSASAGMTNTLEDCKALGTKAISLVTPNNPTFSLSQAIGEFRKDGLPSVVGTDLLKEKSRFLKGKHSGTGFARGAGADYLNVEFGWKPLVSDLKSFARSVKDSHEVIKSFQAQSDQKIRRRRAFPTSKESRSLAGLMWLRPMILSSVQADASTTEEKEIRSWFSGAFRYHVPVSDDIASKMARYESYANHLLGVRLTPEVVWNLAPWSWAADWFTNTGDVMKNISNLGTDGMAMQYGYMMRHTRKTTSTGFTYAGRSGYFRKTEESKRRVPASPYGFNTTFDGLSNRQKAICAAIGITRR